MSGDLEVLNVAAGDMKFSFNSDDPLEVARAERVVVDMLRRGYLLFVETDGKLHRATEFDAATHEYIIADGADPHAEDSATAETGQEQAKSKRSAKKKPAKRKVKAASCKATAVAPTAGG